MTRQLIAVAHVMTVLVVLSGCGRTTPMTATPDQDPVEATHLGTWRATHGPRTFTLTFLKERYIHHHVTHGGAPYVESGGWTATATTVEKMWLDHNNGALRTATKEYAWIDDGNAMRMPLFANEDRAGGHTDLLTWRRVADPVVDMIGTWQSRSLRSSGLYATTRLELRADGTFSYQFTMNQPSGEVVEVRITRSGAYDLNEDIMAIVFTVGDASNPETTTTMRMDYVPTDRVDKIRVTIMYDVESGPISRWGAYISDFVKQD